MSGSMTSSRAPRSATAASRAGRSSGSSGGRSSPSSPVTAARVNSRLATPPAAASRGRMVSSSPSSAERMTDAATGPTAPSGMSPSRLRRAARSSSRVDLPTPGSPSRTVSLPRGIQPGQSHSTGRDTTALRGRRRAWVDGRLGMGRLAVVGTGRSSVPRGRGVWAGEGVHEPRVKAVQLGTRCGSRRADCASIGPESSTGGPSACRIDARKFNRTASAALRRALGRRR